MTLDLGKGDNGRDDWEDSLPEFDVVIKFFAPLFVVVGVEDFYLGNPSAELLGEVLDVWRVFYLVDDDEDVGIGF